jgi:hypothetical protein
MRLYLEFDKIVRALIAAKARFAVAGGLAVGLHGYLRATKDIDFLAREVDLPKIRKVLRKLGYRESGESCDFPKSGLGLHRFYHRPARSEDLLLVDVLIARSRQIAAIVRRAKRVPYADLKLPVVALEDLYTMKMLRGSTQDKADIEHLKAKNTK